MTKKSWRGEAVKLRNTLACRVLGGRFRTWTREELEAVKLRLLCMYFVLGGEV